MKLPLAFFLFALLVHVDAQTAVPYMTTVPTPPATNNATAYCAELQRLSDELDSLVYASQGVGAPLGAEGLNFTAVSSYLAPNNFTWQDYSALPSAGNYSSYDAYWPALNAALARWPLLNSSVDWYSCDPVARRLVSQWKEAFGSATDSSLTETSTSIYVTEFNPNLKVTRQAYWTSGNVAKLVASAQ